MLSNIIRQIVRYEHIEWAKLHKMHISGTALVILVSAFGVLSINSSHSIPANALQSHKKTHKKASSSSTVSHKPHPAKPTSSKPATAPPSSATSAPSTSTKNATTSPPAAPVITATQDASTPPPAPPILANNKPITTQPVKIVPAPTINGGYPAKWYEAPIDSILDPWGYLNREGTSYAAFKVIQEDPGDSISNLGNANQWPQNTTYSMGTTPESGSVLVRPNSKYGEVYFIESVDTTSKTFSWSAYNVDGLGMYSTGVDNFSSLTSTPYQDVFIYFNQPPIK